MADEFDEFMARRAIGYAVLGGHGVRAGDADMVGRWAAEVVRTGSAAEAYLLSRLFDQLVQRATTHPIDEDGVPALPEGNDDGI